MAGAGAWLRKRLRRRVWPLAVAVLTAGLGTAYPIVFTYRSGHLRLWSVPGDLWGP